MADATSIERAVDRTVAIQKRVRLDAVRPKGDRPNSEHPESDQFQPVDVHVEPPVIRLDQIWTVQSALLAKDGGS